MYIVIVNPVAGNGKAKKIFNQVKQSTILKNKTIFYITEYKGHIKEIIRDIEKNKRNGLTVELLFIIGGDGTVNEVINALTDFEMPIAYIPGGSGNDFARGINSLSKSDEIIENALQNSHTLTYWLAKFQGNDNMERKFANCLGFGFDAVVAKSASTLSFRNLLSFFYLDSFIYLFALLKELPRYRPRKIEVMLNEEKRVFSKVLFLTINNQPYMGGGMKINPVAENDGALLSIIVVDSIPKWKVFLLFGTVFLGKHIHFKEVQLFQGNEISIVASENIPCQIDGEYVEMRKVKVTKHKSPLLLKGLPTST